MAEYVLKSGKVVSDGDIDEMCSAIERGELPGPGWSGEVVMGRPRLSREKLDVISVKIPHSQAMRIKQAAELTGKSRSGFMRDTAIERANETLAVAALS